MSTFIASHRQNNWFDNMVAILLGFVYEKDYFASLIALTRNKSHLRHCGDLWSNTFAETALVPNHTLTNENREKHLIIDTSLTEIRKGVVNACPYSSAHIFVTIALVNDHTLTNKNREKHLIVNTCLGEIRKGLLTLIYYLEQFIADPSFFNESFTLSKIVHEKIKNSLIITTTQQVSPSGKISSSTITV